MIWVVDKPHREDSGAYGDEVARAVNLLVKHHADDAETARLGLSLHGVFSRHRDTFLEGVYANAKGHEAKGLARLALARYLEAKAPWVAGAHVAGPPPPIMSETYNEEGEKTKKSVDWSNEYRGYRIQHRILDPEAVRREAERLYEEVIAEYADVPYITTHHRDLERRLKKRPTDPNERAERKRTQGIPGSQEDPDVGRGRLGAARRDAEPCRRQARADFEGVGVDGEPIKLSDLRGKVVTLIFWGTTCDPYIRELPDERKLAEAMRGKPFTFLGIVCDDQSDAARKVVDSEMIAWPNILKGGEAIAERYHVEGYPSHVVIDAQGVIRAKRFDVDDPHPVLDPLVKEAEEAAKK